MQLYKYNSANCAYVTWEDTVNRGRVREILFSFSEPLSFTTISWNLYKYECLPKMTWKRSMHKKPITSKWIFGQNFTLKPFRHTLCSLNWRSADIEQRLSVDFSPKRILIIGSKYLWSLSHDFFLKKEEIIREISKHEIFSLCQPYRRSL